MPKQFISIDQAFALSNDLNLSEALICNYLSCLPDWAEKVVIDGSDFYFASKTKIAEDLPLISTKPDTIYRIMKGLSYKGLVRLIKVGRKDFVSLSENFTKLGNISDFSEINPTKLGKKSDLNSEKNPTYRELDNRKLKIESYTLKENENEKDFENFEAENSTYKNVVNNEEVLQERELYDRLEGEPGQGKGEGETSAHKFYSADSKIKEAIEKEKNEEQIQEASEVLTPEVHVLQDNAGMGGTHIFDPNIRLEEQRTERETKQDANSGGTTPTITTPQKAFLVQNPNGSPVINWDMYNEHSDRVLAMEIVKHIDRVRVELSVMPLIHPGVNITNHINGAIAMLNDFKAVTATLEGLEGVTLIERAYAYCIGVIDAKKVDKFYQSKASNCFTAKHFAKEGVRMLSAVAEDAFKEKEIDRKIEMYL